MIFSTIMVFEYLELPYGNVLLSLFSAGKVSVVGNSSFPVGKSPSRSGMTGNMTLLNGSTSTNSYQIHERANHTRTSKEMGRDPKDGLVAYRDRGSSKSLGFYEFSNAYNKSSSETQEELNTDSMVDDANNLGNGSSPEEARQPKQSFYQKNSTTDGKFSVGEGGKGTNTSTSEHIGSSDTGSELPSPALPSTNSSRNAYNDSSSETLEELNRYSTVYNANNSGNGSAPEEGRQPKQNFDQKNSTADGKFSVGKGGKETNSSKSERIGSSDTGSELPSPALPSTNSSHNAASPMFLETNIRTPLASLNTSSVEKNEMTTSKSNKRSGQWQSGLNPWGNSSSWNRVREVTNEHEMPTSAVISISKMNDLFLQGLASYQSMVCVKTLDLNYAGIKFLSRSLYWREIRYFPSKLLCLFPYFSMSGS